MNPILMILEVSKKQDYIFSTQKLRENADRSEDIRIVTSDDFFRETAGELYSTEENMVYSGGGHTVLQFEDRERASAFAARVTEAVLRRYDGLELFVKQMVYQSDRTPGENLKQLMAELERKKSRRKNSFHRLTFGLEKLDRESFRPKRTLPPVPRDDSHQLKPPYGYEFSGDMDKIAGNDTFVAVVHIDGNAMGSRVAGIYEAAKNDWALCCQKLRRFSAGIQADFEDSFSEMTQELLRLDDKLCQESVLPVRPVILAGDDVCFVARGNLGLECARIFLEKLAAKTNCEDHLPYSACAGVAIVHLKYPFHQAYDLAEELCENAKRFGSRKDPERRISAMDWHIEFGQIQDGLGDIRRDYETEDGGCLELRPVVVVLPRGIDRDQETALRSYRRFSKTVQKLKKITGQGGGANKIARWKMKDLRTAMKQGEQETQYFLEDTSMRMLVELAEENFFVTLDHKRHCTLFDAIEMMDHCTLLKGAGE